MFGGPGSAVHRSTTLHAAPQPGHERKMHAAAKSIGRAMVRK